MASSPTLPDNTTVVDPAIKNNMAKSKGSPNKKSW